MNKAIMLCFAMLSSIACTKDFPVSSVSLDMRGVELNVGESKVLTAVIAPSQATDKSVSWSSSDNSIATVDTAGKVTAVKSGAAQVIATVTDGGFADTCTVAVLRTYSYSDEYVDLGLSVKWATCNLGALKPEESGGWYAWGETKAYCERDLSNTTNYSYSGIYAKTYYFWDSYKYCNGSQYGLTKYCTSPYMGTVDNKTALEPEDDAAAVALGGDWRIPTRDEWDELCNNCSRTWTQDYNGTGIPGLIMTSRIEGYKNSSIFLPAAGAISKSRLQDYATLGVYWSSTMNSEFCEPYCCLTTEHFSTFTCFRYYGYPIRPVKN
ncbi:MAG: Ig-like domain-containing protein [Bacteroidia bacterium]|nr:Ig-like domain-containing protein [Bacteroidia bacterium]